MEIKVTKPGIDVKKPVGNGITTPQYGNPNPPVVRSADMKNKDTDLNQTASSENLSAKFKHPRVSQDVPPEGQGQYM